MQQSLRPALFLDRDGVVNRDSGYPHLAEHIEFIPGIAELTRAARQAGYMVVVVTNQAGIGRGMYSEAQFHALMAWMQAQLAAMGGGWDAYYFCPHHPEGGQGDYLRECDSRKPGPGMLLKAAREHGLDLGASVMVGDRESDRAAAKAAGVGKFLLSNGVDLQEIVEKWQVPS